MIEGVIFDMDGLLIDSEPLWQEALRDSFAAVGVALTRKECTETIGFRLDEVVAHWHKRYPWSGKTLTDVEADILSRVSQLIALRGEPKEGVQEALDFLRSRSVPIGLASGSYYLIIDAVMEKFGIRDYFDVIHSAQDEKRGKPQPDVFLTVAKRLSVDPMHVVVFEDSRNGIAAAKAAGMLCIAIPDRSMPVPQDVSLADRKIVSLKDVNGVLWEGLSHLL